MYLNLKLVFPKTKGSVLFSYMKSLTVNLQHMHFCRDPYCVNPQRHILSNITHSLRRPRAPVTDVHSRTRSTDTAQSQCMAAICMWVDPTLPRTADGMSFRPHPASLNSARPRELRPTSNLLPHPNWISYLGLWRKDTAMIWRGGI